MTGVEFSVDGLGPFGCGTGQPCFNFTDLLDPAGPIGPTIAAPDDKQNGSGGLNIAWSHRLRDDRVCVRIDLTSPGAVARDVVLRVQRR